MKVHEMIMAISKEDHLVSDSGDHWHQLPTEPAVKASLEQHSNKRLDGPMRRPSQKQIAAPVFRKYYGNAETRIGFGSLNL